MRLLICIAIFEFSSMQNTHDLTETNEQHNMAHSVHFQPESEILVH